MILVIGGTGVVGSRVVEGLLTANQQVRVLAGGMSDWRDNVTPQFRRAGVEMISGDIRDQRAIAAAVQGCTGIVHVAGIISPYADLDYESVNVESVASLLPIAENAGVQRLIYVSCLGATQFSTSAYLQSKWQAETMVRSSRFLWTIFRPTLIFGPHSQLTRSVEYWVSRFPIVMVIGSGLNQIQPISAEDVATCIVQSIYNRDAVNQTYDLVGPQAITLHDLLEMSCTGSTGRQKPLVRIPATVAYKLADLLLKLNPRSPISSDFLKLLTAEILSDPMLVRQNFKTPMLPFDSQYKQLPPPR